MHDAIIYHYQSGSWVARQTGIDPSTVGNLKERLNVVEGLFLAMGERTGKATPREWDFVIQRIREVFVDTPFPQIVANVTANQDHIAKTTGPSRKRGETHPGRSRRGSKYKT